MMMMMTRKQKQSEQDKTTRLTGTGTPQAPTAAVPERATGEGTCEADLGATPGRRGSAVLSEGNTLNKHQRARENGLLGAKSPSTSNFPFKSLV